MQKTTHIFLLTLLALTCMPAVTHASSISSLFCDPILEETSIHNISHLNAQAEKLFNYDPAIELINGANQMAEVTFTCHGYGGNKGIGHYFAPHIDTPVLTFNFPDYDAFDRSFVTLAVTSKFGTLHEYLPMIYALRACVNSGITKINLYGRSAGGGAIINTLAILNNHKKYAKELHRIGVSQDDACKIVNAIAAGRVILDVPLKSLAEIHAFRPNDLIISAIAKRFKKNGFEPIEVIDQLAGMELNVIIYFEHRDEILSNRDDQLFYQKLKTVNKDGVTHLIMGSDGGHNGFHAKLWTAVKGI